MERILKQTSWLISVQILTRILGFFYTIFLAKHLGVSEFGLLTVALAYFSIISSIADFGFNRFLIREISMNELKISELLCNVLMLRLTLSSVLFALFAIFLYILDADKIRVSLILLSTLAILPQSIALSYDAIFIATRNLKFSAIALLLSSLFTALAGLYLISQGFGSIGAVNALIFGQFVYAVSLFVLLYKSKGLLLSNIKLSILKKALVGSLPYGLLGVLGLLYFKVDAIILSYLKGSFETGIYGVAYKFLEAVMFVPGAFAAALFPVFSRIHDSSPKDLKKMYFKSFKMMLILGILVVLGYILILPEVIKNFLPKYLSSIESIKILSLSIPFMFIHVPAVSILLSTDKYLKGVLLLSIVTLTFNLVANLVFIPQFGFIAASWITALSEVLSFIIFFLYLKNKILDARN